MSTYNISGILLYLFTGALLAAPKNLEKCRQWALEDGVPAIQIGDYVRKCTAEYEDNSPPPSPPAPKDDNSESQRNKTSLP